MEKNFKLGVIGGGFMAQAIVNGALGKGFLRPSQVIVSEPNEERRNRFQDLGVTAVSDNRNVAESCAFLLFAVKPQIFHAVADELKGADLPVLVSIMAGKTKDKIREELGFRGKVARIMPNLPCSVGEGMAGADVTELCKTEKEFVLGLFSSVGKAIEAEEALLNAVTGISGSGPAYVYLFIKSLVEAGIEQGLTESQAQQLALQTFKGGVKMAEVSGKSLSELIAAVSSKGGTTVAALDSFENDDIGGSVKRAVAAAVRRAEELSE